MNRSTLRNRLYSLVFLWVVVLSAVAIVATQSSSSSLREEAIEERMLLGRSVAHGFDEQLSHLFADLRQLSSRLQPPYEDEAETLRALRFAVGFRRAVYVTDEKGSVLASDPPVSQPLPAEWLQGRELVTASWTRPGAATAVAAIVQPFHAEGRLRYLVAEMELGQGGFDGLLDGLATPPDLYLFVIDLSGRILAAGTPGAAGRVVPAAAVETLATSRALALTTRGCYLCADQESTRMLTVVVPLELAPWTLVVQQEASRVLGGARWSRIHLVAALALVALTGVFLAWALSRSVADPLAKLSAQAERLREGDLSSEIAIGGDREIFLLAEILDEARRRLASTLGELREVNETLEHQVEIRTLEIRKLLDRTLAQDAGRRNLVRRLLSAGEEERRRIARELHDEIAQLLTVVVLALDDIPDSDGTLARARELLARTQREIKRIIADLRPSLLDDLGLSMAVRGHARDFLEARGLTVSLEVEDDLELPSEVETTAFRIYQEIVTNVVRHSGAEHVAVELYVDDGRLTLSVEDDGVGFVPADKAGTGIVGLYERASLVGGTVKIDSAPGTGTHVLFECPAMRARGDDSEVETEEKAVET